MATLLEGFEKAERGRDLLAEYQSQSTPEARYVKAMDRLDMALQAQSYERDHGVDLSEFGASARPVLERAELLHWLS